MTNGEKFEAVFGFGADGSRVIAVNSTWWDCQFQDSKPFTNADRIRSMTDEELAEWIFDRVKCQNCQMLPCVKHGEDGKGNCKELWLAWLREDGE